MSEQRRALANTTPTTEVIRDAVTFPRDRLGEPLDISGERFDAWLAQVKRTAAREALDRLAEQETETALGRAARDDWHGFAQCEHARQAAEERRDTHYPELEEAP